MKNFTLSKRLWVLGISILGCLGILAIFSTLGSQKIMTQLTEVAQIDLPAVRNMTYADMMHDGLRGVVMESLIVAHQKDKKRTEELWHEAEEKSKEFNKYIGDLDSLPLNSKIKEAIQEVKPFLMEYTEAVLKVTEKAHRGEVPEALAMLPAFSEIFKKLETKMEVLGDLIEKEANQTRGAGAETVSLILVISAFSTVFALALIVFISRDINKIFAKLVFQLKNIVEQSDKSSIDVGSASRAVAESSTEQAAAIQESVAAMTEVSNMISFTARGAQESLTSTQKVLERSQEGEQVLHDLTNSMMGIQEANGQLQRISDVILEIHSKTKVINDIVFKTQLLSFNASIEAARAGIHGKGFAVVAEEVGKLALVSGTSAKEIEDLLNSSQTQVGSVLKLITGRVDQGNRVTGDAVKNFRSITESIKDIAQRFKEIADACSQQEKGVQQTTVAMNQIDTSSQRNNMAATAAAKASADLLRDVSELRRVASDIQSLVVAGKNRSKEFGNPEKLHSEVVAAPHYENSSEPWGSSLDRRTGEEFTADDPSFKKEVA